jgi:hypothetical protein
MILSMFRDKTAPGMPYSMTRVVSCLFALTVCASLLLYARGKAQVGWPFAALGIVTLMAVPLQAMWAMLVKYFTSRPGEALLGQVIEHVAPLVVGSVVKTTEHTEHTEERQG